jgi:hypothetical protein
MWLKINKIEESSLNNSELIYFNYFGREVYSIVSDKVKMYLKIDSFKYYKEVFVVKTFSRNDKPLYLIKKVR